MHGLQKVQTSLGIQPLPERLRNGFPHPLQDLRDVHRMQASLLRPSVHGPRHTALYEMRRSDNSAGVLHMLQDTRQENVPCFSVGLEVNHTKIPELVPTMHQLPHLYKRQSEQELQGVSPSFVSVQRVCEQQKMWSVRPGPTNDCVSRIAMEKGRRVNSELDSTLHSVPLLRNVLPDQTCKGLRSESKNLHGLPAKH